MAGPFDFLARYVTALSRFSQTDLAYQSGSGIRGAKPSAASLEAGYQFNVMDRGSRAMLSYQRSNEARNANGAVHALVMPRNRVSMGYGVEVFKNTMLAFEVRRDHDYSNTEGGTDQYDNAAFLRMTAILY
jgi:hypothetical protein